MLCLRCEAGKAGDLCTTRAEEPRVPVKWVRSVVLLGVKLPWEALVSHAPGGLTRSCSWAAKRDASPFTSVISSVHLVHPYRLGGSCCRTSVQSCADVLVVP